MQKITLTRQDVAELVQRNITARILRFFPDIATRTVSIYGIPRGGVAIAEETALQLIKEGCSGVTVTKDPNKADIVVDDLVDSGATRDRLLSSLDQAVQFYCAVDKSAEPYKNLWLVFPWEISEEGEDQSAHDIVVRMLQRIGEDPAREGLKETPARVVKAWGEWFAGYSTDPKTVLKTFEDGSEKYDEMVIVHNIPVHSHCEHHITPFIGHAHVAYIPNKRIVGLSKLSRIVDVYARRLQVQERLTRQIADIMQEELDPLGVAVLIRAQHFCMCTRGVKVAGSTTTTSALRGVLKTDAAARAEFLALCTQADKGA